MHINPLCSIDDQTPDEQLTRNKNLKYINLTDTRERCRRCPTCSLVAKKLYYDDITGWLWDELLERCLHQIR